MKNVFFTLSLILLSSVWTMLSATLFYYCDFENQEECTHWVLNPTPNQTVADQLVSKWYIGEAENNTISGQHSLYISDDGGVSAHYAANNCFVVAYDVVTLDHLASGNYQLSFDYRVANSEGLCVFWIPQDDGIKVLSNTMGTIPYLYTDYGLQIQPSVSDFARVNQLWEQCTVTIPNSQCNGQPHYLVFAWKNDAASMAQPGAVIDNIEITDGPACDAPTELNVSLDNGQVTLSWKGTGSAYQVTALSYNTKQWFGPVDVNSNTYTFTDLPESLTEFIVRGKCADNQFSHKAIANAIVYTHACLDYLNLNDAICYIGADVANTYTFNTYTQVPAVDFGPLAKESRHTVHFYPNEVDVNTCSSLQTIPDDKMASVRLGNWNNNAETERIEYSFVVDTVSMPVMLLKYAPVLEAPNHHDYENPRFTMNVFIKDQNDTCVKADFNANDVLSEGQLRPEAVAQGWHLATKDQIPLSENVVWKEWTSVGVNLKKPEYQGKTMTVQLTTYDCTYRAHCGYTYFTLGCIDGKLKTIKNANNTTFTAPEGFVYQWFLAKDEINRDAYGRIPDALILGRSQTFTVDEDDENTYAVDCSFVQDPNNYFTLYASSANPTTDLSSSPEVKYVGDQNSYSTCPKIKFIHNGQLFIQRGNELFNAQGARVK